MPSRPQPTPATFGQSVRELREERGASQERIADLAGISTQYFSDIERGLRNPTLVVLAQIATAYGMRLSELIARAERGPTP